MTAVSSSRLGPSPGPGRVRSSYSGSAAPAVAKSITSRSSSRSHLVVAVKVTVASAPLRRAAQHRRSRAAGSALVALIGLCRRSPEPVPRGFRGGAGRQHRAGDRRSSGLDALAGRGWSGQPRNRTSCLAIRSGSIDSATVNRDAGTRLVIGAGGQCCWRRPRAETGLPVRGRARPGRRSPAPAGVRQDVTRRTSRRTGHRGARCPGATAGPVCQPPRDGRRIRSALAPRPAGPRRAPRASTLPATLSLGSRSRPDGRAPASGRQATLHAGWRGCSIRLRARLAVLAYPARPVVSGGCRSRSRCPGVVQGLGVWGAC